MEEKGVHTPLDPLSQTSGSFRKECHFWRYHGTKVLLCLDVQGDGWVRDHTGCICHGSVRMTSDGYALFVEQDGKRRVFLFSGPSYRSKFTNYDALFGSPLLFYHRMSAFRPLVLQPQPHSIIS